jgi:hypothetical protein
MKTPIAAYRTPRPCIAMLEFPHAKAVVGKHADLPWHEKNAFHSRYENNPPCIESPSKRKVP